MRDKNILLVDYLTDRIIFFIERFGHQNLDITESASDAIKYIVENLYDYLFLSGELGQYGGNCIEIASFLRRHPDNPNYNSKIIVHSLDIMSAGEIIKLLPTADYIPFNQNQFSTLFNI